MRQKTPLTAKNDPNSTSEPPVNDNTPPTINGINASTAALLHRTMESLSELPPELEESNE
uniref:Uncharacterized protein n=1 Tax=Acrobeloides nanus TaxID=290746 RepID=A0A914DB08_9BILA